MRLSSTAVFGGLVIVLTGLTLVTALDSPVRVVEERGHDGGVVVDRDHPGIPQPPPGRDRTAECRTSRSAPRRRFGETSIASCPSSLHTSALAYLGAVVVTP